MLMMFVAFVIMVSIKLTFVIGFWSKDSSMSGVDSPYPADIRNFLGEEMVVGRRNVSTTDETSSLDDEGPSAPNLLNDVLHFLTVRLNAT